MSAPWSAALLAVALAGWIALYARLWHSFHGMYPATGVLAALADGVLRGQSPGHDDGATMLAGFYFPPYALWVAALRGAGLAWLDALRVAAAAGGVLVLVAAAALARALGGGARGALVAAALAAVAYPFRDAVMSSRSDLFATAASIAALAAWARDRDLRGWGAPAFAAASLLCKATSVAMPAGVLLWALVARRPAGAWRFAWRMAACAAAGVALSVPVHGPAWYADALHALFFATPSTFNPLRGPLELLRYAGTFPELLWTLAASIALLGARRPDLAPARAFGIVSLAVTAYLMTNFGAGPNHLLELSTLAAALAAAWAAPRLSRAWLPLAFVTLSVCGATWRDLVPAIRHAREPVNLRAGILAAVAAEPGDVLTEDPLLSLCAGRRPFVSDPGAWRSFSLAGDPRALRMIAAVESRRFSLVVLNEDLDASAHWYETVHLGPRVVAAIRASYRDTGTVGGYHLLRPRPEPAR